MEPKYVCIPIKFMKILAFVEKVEAENIFFKNSFPALLLCIMAVFSLEIIQNQQSHQGLS